MFGRSIIIGSRVLGNHGEMCEPHPPEMDEYGTNRKRFWRRILTGKVFFNVCPNTWRVMWDHGYTINTRKKQ